MGSYVDNEAGGVARTYTLLLTERKHARTFDTGTYDVGVISRLGIYLQLCKYARMPIIHAWTHWTPTRLCAVFAENIRNTR